MNMVKTLGNRIGDLFCFGKWQKGFLVEQKNRPAIVRKKRVQRIRIETGSRTTKKWTE